MGSSAMVPRAFSVTDAKRAREEADRLAERRDGARNASATTVGSGGRLDVDGGDLSILNGGNASVRDGGRFLVEDGGGMDITDSGTLTVTGTGLDFADGTPYTSRMIVENRATDPANLAALAPSIRFDNQVGGGVYTSTIRSQAGTDITVDTTDGGNNEATLTLDPASRYFPQASLTSTSSLGRSQILLTGSMFALSLYDTASNIRGAVSCYQRGGPSGPYPLSLSSPDGIELWGNTNVIGAFTVNGVPVGGAVSSVAGKTGAVTLVKGDVGLPNVDNTSDANKPVATATTNGLLPATDKAKLDGATPSATANRLIYRDTSGRAQTADPSAAADIATKGYVDAADAALTAAIAALKPFAIAAGIIAVASVANGGSSGQIVISLPAGRFTQPPLIIIQAPSARLTSGILATATTSGSFSVSFDNKSGAASTAGNGSYVAIQMSSGSAAG